MRCDDWHTSYGPVERCHERATVEATFKSGTTLNLCPHHLEYNVRRGESTADVRPNPVVATKPV
jgi:hypothetical protein